MFLGILLWIVRIRTNRVLNKIIELNAVPGNEQLIAKLTNKHNRLSEKFMLMYAEYIRPKPLKHRTPVQNITRQMLWICSIGLVLLVVLAYMSQPQ